MTERSGPGWTGSVPEGTHTLDDAYAQSIAAQAVTPAPVAQPLSAPRSCAFCNWNGDVGAEAHATLIHPDKDWAVVPQFGHAFVIDMGPVRDAARSVPDNAALGLAALDRLDALFYEGEPGGVTVADYRAAADVIRAALRSVPDNAALREALRAEMGWSDYEIDGFIGQYHLAAAPASPSGSSPAAAGLDDAYRERNAVVAALIRVGGYPASVMLAPDAEGWWIVYAETPQGQVSWHVAPVDIRLFDGMPRRDAVWDGHSTDEKYERVAALASPADLHGSSSPAVALPPSDPALLGHADPEEAGR